MLRQKTGVTANDTTRIVLVDAWRRSATTCGPKSVERVDPRTAFDSWRYEMEIEEYPATVDARGVHPERVGELPEGLGGIVPPRHSIRRLLMQSFLEGSKRLLQTLLPDPVVPSARAAEGVLQTVFSLRRDCLLDLR